MTALVAPVIELVALSVAVIVWLPAVLSVTLNVPVPLVKRAVGRQSGLAVAAGEMHRAAVGGGRVVERRPGRHRDVERRARRDRTGGSGDVEVGGGGGADGDGRWCR